jgi:hypothetical protein
MFSHTQPSQQKILNTTTSFLFSWLQVALSHQLAQNTTNCIQTSDGAPIAPLLPCQLLIQEQFDVRVTAFLPLR